MRRRLLASGAVHWLPRIGKPLPRAAEAIGVREKLAGYSLDANHEHGGPKARGFELVLGITLGDVDYLELEIRTGILMMPVSAVRDNTPWGIKCVVEVPVRGLGEKRRRSAGVRTVWAYDGPGAPPRLVSAFLRT